MAEAGEIPPAFFDWGHGTASGLYILVEAERPGPE